MFRHSKQSTSITNEPKLLTTYKESRMKKVNQIGRGTGGIHLNIKGTDHDMIQEI